MDGQGGGFRHADERWGIDAELSADGGELSSTAQRILQAADDLFFRLFFRHGAVATTVRKVTRACATGWSRSLGTGRRKASCLYRQRGPNVARHRGIYHLDMCVHAAEWVRGNGLLSTQGREERYVAMALRLAGRR